MDFCIFCQCRGGIPAQASSAAALLPGCTQILPLKSLMNQKPEEINYSKMLVRSELVKEYITFFKERMPEMLWQFSASAGAIIALFFYDYRIGLVCLAVIVPVAYINNINQKKSN